jgi:DNA-binding beta-propeller fold protein YncE
MTQHAATTPTSGRPDNLNAEQVTVVPNPGPHAYLPDVEFSPCGARYAVTERDNNRVRLHDSATHAVLRTFEGMDAGLDYPHGLALGDRFLFVSNQGSSRAAPTSICCFGLDGVSSKPSSIVPTPDPRWREPHSLALHGEQLFCTYCEGEIVGLAVYAVDASRGVIDPHPRFISDCFRGHGDPKGVAVDGERGRVYVSFVSEARVPLRLSNWRQKLRRAVALGGAAAVWRRLRGFLARRLRGTTASPEVRNGIMTFELTAGGCSDTPLHITYSTDYTRFENIDIRDDLLAIADPINNRVVLYSLRDGALSAPQLTLSDTLTFPHDVAISPDRQTLIVSNYGISSHEGEVMWNCFSDPRGDSLVIFHRSA